MFHSSGEIVGMNEKTSILAHDLISKAQSNGDLIKKRTALSKAITLIESQSLHDMQQADLLMDYLVQHQMNTCERSFRIGITGSPGVGKSSFIEKFGNYLLSLKDDHDQTIMKPSKLACVCIDPSSSLTGGSILGDKTRMTELSKNPKAFVRPSPSKGVLGGVSTYTNDAVSICHAAGYDLVIIESVGVGQSEIDISHGVDLVIVMVAPGAGDSLQGIKRGIVEVCDICVVNKADGNMLLHAQNTQNEYKSTSQFWRSRDSRTPPVLLCSSITGEGMTEIWQEICKFRQDTTIHDLVAKRGDQLKYWTWKRIQDLIIAKTKSNGDLIKKTQLIDEALSKGNISPRAAAWRILEGFRL